MATSVGSGDNIADLVKDYICDGCESKTIDKSADWFCRTCMNYFCGKCIYHHDRMYANHSKYGRGAINKWPLTKKAEDLLLKCDYHNNNKLKMFCDDHGQLCCLDCVLLNHRQCSNVALISQMSAKTLSVDMQQLSNNLQTILNELDEFKSSQETSIQTMDISYIEKLQEIRDMRQKLNAALDKLENTTLKELDNLRAALQTSIKKDIDNCSRLKDELQQLSEAVQDLSDKSTKEIEFISSRKCLNKIQESETYLEKNTAKAERTLTFQEHIRIEQFLCKQWSLGRISEGMQTLTLILNPDQVMTVKKKSEYDVRISSDEHSTCHIVGICSLPNGHVIVTDYNNMRVKLLNEQYNVASHCDVSGNPSHICQVTSSEVVVVVDTGEQFEVQFIMVVNGQIVNGWKFQLRHDVTAIAHLQGALYVTSGSALYHYDMTGTLVKTLCTGLFKVLNCAVSPDGERIYVSNHSEDQLITLATDGTLISTFTDPELLKPDDVHVTPSGQVLVYGYGSKTIIQVDREGRKKLATLASEKDGLYDPLCFGFNANTNSIIVGLYDSDKILVMEVH